MIIRDYQQKEVMLISDHPLENESKRGTSYTEPSQTTLKDSLNSASFNACKNSDTKHLLNSTTICFTYLSINRYAKGDYDWQHSIVSKRGIPADHNYYQIPWLKDIWVSPDLWYELQDLIKQIKEVKPKIIVLAGKWSFLLLASLSDEPTKQLATIANTKSKPTEKKWFGALSTYRSSILTLHEGLGIPAQTIVFPILTPAYLFLIKEKQFVVNRDYAKLARIHREVQEGADVTKWLQPNLKTDLGLTAESVFKYLQELYSKLQESTVLVSMDIETRQGYTDCIGIAYEHNRSLTIPYSYMQEEVNTTEGFFAYLTKNKVETYQEVPVGGKILNYKNFWTLDEELVINELLWKVMLHPNCRHVGQNYNYDCQYYFHQWKLRISSFCDTMILHHVLYNYMQKDLAFLASIYCDYFVYWKDELHSKNNETRWKYNGKDCIYTLIIADLLLQIINAQSETLKAFYQFQQFKVVPNIVTIMNRGVKVDIEEKEKLRVQFTELMEGCLEKINYIFNEEINLNSTPQVKRAFKDLLGIKPVLNRKTKKESFGSDAMLVYLEAYPEWRTLLTLFLEYKSIKVFVRTFLSAKVDTDGHMRCDYNPAGTKTYRLSSRKNVFGNGMNLANVPSKGKIDLRIALQEIEQEDKEEETDTLQFQSETGNIYEGKLALPNCKNIFLPSDDKVFFDADYSAIDLHFVIWESDCQFLKDIIRAGKDVYSILASHYYQREISKKDEERQIFKAICHGCLTGEHEVLTPNGWVTLESLDDFTSIAVWNKDTRSIHFELPNGINRDFVEADEDLYEIKGAAFHQVSTQDHTFPYTVDKPHNLKATQAIKLPKSARLPYNGHFIGGGIEDSLAYMRLIAALQADGSINHIAKDGTVTYRFKFVKERKITRMRGLLTELGIDFKEWTQTDNSATTGNIRTCFSFKDVLIPEMKKLDWWILDYSKECINAWLEELQYWDGHTRTSNGMRTSITTTDKLAAEVIQTVAHLCGKGSKILAKPRDITRQTLYEVSLNNRMFHNMSTGTASKVAHKGTMVYCPRTSTGFFMVRHNGNIMVTGNTNYLGKAPTLAAKAGLSIGAVNRVIQWYFKECPEIPTWHKVIENTCRKQRYVENVFGARFWCLDFDDPMWLNKMVAAIPQSSAAILVNKALCTLEEHEQGKIQTLLQVHDSLAGQFHKEDVTAVQRIKSYMEIEIPYKDRLVIPAQIKTSSLSYGDCH